MVVVMTPLMKILLQVVLLDTAREMAVAADKVADRMVQEAELVKVVVALVEVVVAVVEMAVAVAKTEVVEVAADKVAERKVQEAELVEVVVALVEVAVAVVEMAVAVVKAEVVVVVNAVRDQVLVVAVVVQVVLVVLGAMDRDRVCTETLPYLRTNLSMAYT
jgi:hypothetical protein